MDVNVESEPLNIKLDVNEAATPAKSAQKSAKKNSAKKSAKKSASKVSITAFTKVGENSIFSPPTQGSPFVKAVSAVKDVVSTVWETIVASPARTVRESIGDVLGSPKNVGSCVEVDKLLESEETKV